MRHKTLLVSTLVVGIIALILLQSKSPSPAPAPAKTALIPADVLSHAQRLEIKANNKAATIEKNPAGEWTVKEKFGLPADVENRLRPLIQSLQNAENLGVLTTNPKRLGKLGLEDSTLTLISNEGKPFVLEIGKTTDDGVGSAIRLQGENVALRSNFTGYLESDPSSWINPLLYSRNDLEIKSLIFILSDGQATFTRTEPKVPFKGKEAMLLEDLSRTLSSLRISDAVEKNNPEAQTAFKQSREVKIEFWDGTIIHTIWGTIEPSDKNQLPKVYVRATHSIANHPLNQLNEKADFISASWVADQIPTSLADLKKRSEPPPEPSAPTELEAVPLQK
jgi:hypothetical protein